MKWVDAYLKEVVEAAEGVDLDQVCEAVRVFQDAYESSRSVYVIGNGGSAANASHLAQDLCKHSSPALGDRPFRVISLADNVSFLTAVSNDVGFKDVFAYLLKRWSDPKDILVAISSSGKVIGA